MGNIAFYPWLSSIHPTKKQLQCWSGALSAHITVGEEVANSIGGVSTDIRSKNHYVGGVECLDKNYTKIEEATIESLCWTCSITTRWTKPPLKYSVGQVQRHQDGRSHPSNTLWDMLNDIKMEEATTEIIYWTYSWMKPLYVGMPSIWMNPLSVGVTLAWQNLYL